MISLSVLEISLLSVGGFLSYQLVSAIAARRRQNSITTPLNGPPSISYLWGWSKEIVRSTTSAEIYEEWVKSYGSMVKMPTLFGHYKVIITDPKAVASFYAKETTTYVQNPVGKVFIEALLGNGLLSAEGEDHKRQRKALTPAFSVASIRRLTDVFFDSAHKATGMWDNILDSQGGEAIIEVQDWMNRISLDSIGTAGFGHEFNALDGTPSAIVDLFESIHAANISVFSTIVFLLSTIHPIFFKIPTERNQMLHRFKATVSQVATELLSKSKHETKTMGEQTSTEKSIIGLLIKAESSEGTFHLSPEEVMAQNVLLLAGYETTSISLTWALIELCKSSEAQDRLRKELLGFSTSDPTYDQLNSSSSLQYLDAVIHETLRLHPPLPETNRVATEDDILPLLYPYTTPSGEVVSRISIAKGTRITAPIGMMNRSTIFWGPDAKEFRPERWLSFTDDADSDVQEKHEGEKLRATEIHGHRHLLTFSDGPRTCLGKNFAVVEFKAVLAVLIKHFTFELPDGPETEIDIHRSILNRPKTMGQSAAKLPLRVRRVA